jgi:hypothetical protein
MFKKEDIVVKTKTKSIGSNRIGNTVGDIWKLNNLTKFSKCSAYYPDGNTHSNYVRLATEHEIDWFEAGITNINQIPEIGGTFTTINDGISKIKSFLSLKVGFPIITNNGPYSLQYWLENYSKSYEPPVKLQHIFNEVSLEEPFKIGDLKDSKIGNLTPEDHKIIQPWLFSLGYNWRSNNTNTIKHDTSYYIIVNTKYITKGNSINYFNKGNNKSIKKETILNYIKQLNTNKNYEQFNKRTEIKQVNGRISGRSISIPIITGSIASASRLIGNKASGKCIKSQFRSFKIRANIITC